MTPDGESGGDTAIVPLAATAGAALAARLPSGADPDEVRDWFEFETIVELPAPALNFAEAEAAAADYRRAARAENTRRAYRAAVARFTDWCYEHRQTALPAAPETVAAFLAAEAGRGLAVNTLRLRHAGLRYLHLLAGYPPPTGSPLVSATFAGIPSADYRGLVLVGVVRRRFAMRASRALTCCSSKRVWIDVAEPLFDVVVIWVVRIGEGFELCIEAGDAAAIFRRRRIFAGEVARIG